MLLKSVLLTLLPAFVAATPVPQASKDIVPGQYIVTLKDGVTAADLEEHESWVGSVHRSNIAFAEDNEESRGIHKFFQINDMNGYSGNFDQKTAAEIARNPLVASVTPDQKVYLATTITQPNATWNLGRMSSNGNLSYDYLYDSVAGQGSWAYVLDTGIQINHTEFEGRAIHGYNAFKNIPHEDNFGHGTYVAGIIAGKTYGVAKKANVVSAKAFDTGSSSYMYILDAYSWMVQNITAERRQMRSVINLSISGGIYKPFNDAIERAYRANVLTVVASGNDGHDAALNTPSSAPNAITVAAIDDKTNQPTFSNYGKIVDIFAPGQNVLSSWKGNTTTTNLASGTSAASPHVAGLCAYLMSIEKFANPRAVTQRVLGLAVKNIVSNPKGAANLVAYNGIRERKSTPKPGHN